MLSRIAVTPGEPAGIGPDVLLQLVQQPPKCQLIAVADPDLLQQRAALLDLPLTLTAFDATSSPVENDAGQLFYVTSEVTATQCKAGATSGGNASYILSTLNAAVELCQRKTCDAMVTGPVNKHLVAREGHTFSGHTEYLAERTDTARVVMMLTNERLRVVLATTHISLREVPDALDTNELLTTLDIVDRDLKQRFDIASPRILVCGLNPHAGEQGDLGREEIEVLEPCLKEARESGINAIGPVPADTAFTPASLAQVDVVMAMYHDQGLPVIKSQSFGDTVNITLGLPIIRTSVDHGTAFDLAGTGRADHNSLRAAVNTAISLADKTAR